MLLICNFLLVFPLWKFCTGHIRRRSVFHRLLAYGSHVGWSRTNFISSQFLLPPFPSPTASLQSKRGERSNGELPFRTHSAVSSFSFFFFLFFLFRWNLLGPTVHREVESIHLLHVESPWNASTWLKYQNQRQNGSDLMVSRCHVAPGACCWIYFWGSTSFSLDCDV